jgi:hypothetical protein
MVKVSIKKNVKPKKITTKKTVKPKKKVAKEKKLTQTQSITVNIQKNRRGVANKKQLPINKPIQQAITPLQSTAPTIKLSNQLTTPSTLTSSILASQEKPNILAKELKDQSALTKALIEQNTDTEVEETKENDLERVRKERIKKFDKPTPIQTISTQTIPTESILTQTIPISSTETIIQERPFYPSFKKITKESRDPVKQGLISQLFEEKGDDTEEINEMIRSSTEGLLRPTASFPNPLSGVSIPKLSNPLSGVSIPKLPNPLTGISNISNSLSSYLNQPSTIEEGLNALYGGEGEEEIFYDAPEEQTPITAEDEYLNQAYAGGVAETKDEEPTDQSQLLRNQQQDQPRQILEQIQPEPTITQALQEEEEIPLVKKKKTKKAEEPPIIQPEPEPSIIQPEPEPIIIEPIQPEPEPEPEPPIIEPIQEDQQLVLYEPPSILKPVENPPTILQPKQEDQPLVLYEPQKIKGSTSTATQQNIGQSDSSIPLPFLRPVNADRLSNLFNISGVALTPQETRDMRQNRLAIFDKKPEDSSFIGPRSTFTETIEDANKTSKLLEDLLKKPDKSAAAEDSDNKEVGVSSQGKEEFQNYITDIEKLRKRQITNGILGKMLIKNDIKDPKTGKVFVIDTSNRVHVKGSTGSLNYQQLTELLLSNYKPGFIYKNIS